jgi:hypothetical protein
MPRLTLRGKLPARFSIIGELRNFAAQQTATNQHVIDQLKSISDRINNIGETGVVLAEYRNTLHERFAKIHEQMGHIDQEVEKHTISLHAVQTVQAAWQSNIKIIVAIAWVGGTIVRAILTSYGHAILRALVAQ